MTSSDRPLSAVLQDILGNLQSIVRSEVRLAKTELREEVSSARVAATLTGVGVMFAIYSLFFLLLASLYALTLVMPNWAAALTVFGFSAVVAAFTLMTGLKQFKKVAGVPKTAASIKENIQWAKQQTR